jgi:uncharacterized protein YneF (UPF0154 family)
MIVFVGFLCFVVGVVVGFFLASFIEESENEERP